MMIHDEPPPIRLPVGEAIPGGELNRLARRKGGERVRPGIDGRIAICSKQLLSERNFDLWIWSTRPFDILANTGGR